MQHRHPRGQALVGEAGAKQDSLGAITAALAADDESASLGDAGNDRLGAVINGAEVMQALMQRAQQV